MNLVKFINNRTEELMDEQESLKSFSLKREGEHEALKIILNFSRFTVKYSMVVKLLFHYLLVKMKITEAPEAVITHKNIVEHNKKLRKLGMKDLKISKTLEMTDGKNA